VVVPAPVAVDPVAFLRQLILGLCRSVPDYDEAAVRGVARARRLTSQTWIVIAGVALLVLALMLATWDDITRLDIAGLMAAIGLTVLYVGLIRGFIRLRRREGTVWESAHAWWQRLRGWYSGRDKKEESASAPEQLRTDVARAAEDVARRMLYQEARKQSRSAKAEWKGIGVTGGDERTLTAHIASDAALVDELRALTDLLTRRGGYKVVIGIDELDKLEADDDAQRFLNSVKVLFTIPDCSFLLSISESALARFALRGLELRDVFDSSFNAVVDVEPLRFREARDLLVLRRAATFESQPTSAVSESEHLAPAMSDTQVLFAYCLAGGGPRDLLRFSGSVIEAAAGRDEVSSADAFAGVLEGEAVDKVQATLLTLRGMPRSESVSGLVALSEKAGAGWSAPGWPVLAESFLADDVAFAGLVQGDAASRPRRTPRNPAEVQVRELRRELFAYLWFLRTVHEAFGRCLPDPDGDNTDPPPGFVALAMARQRLEVDLPAGWRAIGAARVQLGLDRADAASNGTASAP
jgi:hypothetical protein